MLAQNKGDSDRIKNSLPSVVLHQFGNHDGCGDWCQMKNKPTAKHRNLPWGADLKDENMKKDLLKVFTDLDPGKLSKLDSSNPNESFNNTVRSKAPKDKHSCTVHEELGLSPGIATTVRAAIRDKDVNRKRTVAKTKEFKLQRLKLKSQRSSETRSHEIREGDTYCSNVIGYSCETQLFVILHDFMKAFDAGKQIYLAILDLSRAFETVPHNKLLQKMNKYGMRGQIVGNVPNQKENESCDRWRRIRRSFS
ncbi:Hypothetical predicted protein [Mytilus galloprovincialis]|uniref:Reverse transcriptase domain-containing protein n=1 Tax=Mytilus galloprovincialis TaxID=29158 RepID=A0A8B6GE29_MYTGA|nr:Hypothetical predicted protein [Mytilus galloprovincialis]